VVIDTAVAKDREDLAGLQIFSDELGAYIVVVIDTAIYERAAVMKTAYWQTNQCYVFIAKGNAPDTLKIEFRAKDPTQADGLEPFARDFCNRLLDQQVRELVATETGEIRDALVRKAFFEGNKHLDPAILRSDESAIPASGQSYKEDPVKISKQGQE
jgi:His-Xaa-Ser system protein HxsD